MASSNKKKSGFLAFWNSSGVLMVTITSLLLLLLGLWLAIFGTPQFGTREFGGWAHKIMYLHVPFAINAFGAFFFGFLGAGAFLLTDNNRYNLLSRAAVEVGFLFACAVIVSGPLWARPAWGVWWSMEPRLNTFLIMWCLYALYFVIPPFLNEQQIQDRFRSIIAILGFLTVPMVYYSVEMIAAELQSHPSPSDLELDPAMTWTIRLIMAAFFLLFIALTWTRYRLFHLEQKQYKQIIGIQ